MRPTRGFGIKPRRTAIPLLGLAPGGVYLANQITLIAGALLPHRFTLTRKFKEHPGGLFSVALSCKSPRLAVSQHPVLWSPDLPQSTQVHSAVTQVTHLTISVTRLTSLNGE